MLLVSYSSHQNQTAQNDIENKDKTRETIKFQQSRLFNIFLNEHISEAFACD